jgi:ABC-type uncharacterized transport system auxiliary subunit
VPEDRFYRLSTIHPREVSSRTVLTGGLSIDYVRADPLRGGRAVLFRDTRRPLQLQRYHYEFWVDQPPRMVRQALAAYLREAGLADNIVDFDDRTDSAWRLGMRLLKFEQVLDSHSAAVEIALEVSLRSPTSGTPLLTRVYEQRRASDGPGMHDTVSAMRAALGAVFADLQADLTAVRPHGDSRGGGSQLN